MFGCICQKQKTKTINNSLFFDEKNMHIKICGDRFDTIYYFTPNLFNIMSLINIMQAKKKIATWYIMVISMKNYKKTDRR